MEKYRLKKHSLDKGIWLALALLLLIGFSNPHASASIRDSLSKQSSTVITAPAVILQNGTTGTSTVYTNSTSAMVSVPSPTQTLYAHQETTSIGGSTYYRLNTSSADTTGTTITVNAGTLGRVLFGKFIYPLTGVGAIPSSTWTIEYNAWVGTGGAATAHGDIDIVILMANGTTRQTIATHVANSANFPGASPPASSGTYSWSMYNVVEQSDFLEIDYYAHVTTAKSSKSVNLRIDDNTVALNYQTSATNIYLPIAYDYVLRANNTGTDNWQIRLKEYSDSSISRLQNCTIAFHNSTGASLSQIQIYNGTCTTQTGSWCGLGASTTTYIAMVVQTNSTGTSDFKAYLEILTPGATTYIRYILTFQIT